MKKRIVLTLLRLGVMSAVLVSAQSAVAVLGESGDSVDKDRVALKASQPTTRVTKSYSVQELKTKTISVREYLTPSGVVFGIAWNGITHPDLTHLLGSFAEEYATAIRNAPRKHGRRHSQLVTEHIIVEKWGHLRNFKGRAYIKSLIPPGVTIDGIN
jgi:hypothetical protein